MYILRFLEIFYVIYCQDGIYKALKMKKLYIFSIFIARFERVGWGGDGGRGEQIKDKT